MLFIAMRMPRSHRAGPVDDKDMKQAGPWPAMAMAATDGIEEAKNNERRPSNGKGKEGSYLIRTSDKISFMLPRRPNRRR